MKSYLGNKCKILIDLNNKELFYDAILTSISGKHISFIDKFGTRYTYHKDQVKEIHD